MNDIKENDYMQDAKGRLIPKAMVKPQDQLRDQTVKIIVDRFKKKSGCSEKLQSQIHAGHFRAGGNRCRKISG